MHIHAIASIRTLRGLIGAITLLLLGMVGLAVPSGEAAPWRVLLSDDMEAGITGWTKAGAAAFASDTAQWHGGQASARITVKDPAYQQLYRATGEQVSVGSSYRAAAWVRTEGVTAGTGAYLVLEFLGGGKRLAIMHSTMGTANGREQWDRLVAEGMAPVGTDAVRMGMVMHAVGSAWFDDAMLETDAAPVEACKVSQATVRIDTLQVINPDFKGFGFHVFFPMHVKKLTPRLRNEVLYKRWLETRPSFARVTHQWNSGEATTAELAATMRMMQRTSTEVYMTTWDPKATPPGAEREAYAKQVVDMLAGLREQGCDNLRWYCLTNELSMTGDIGGTKVQGWASLNKHLETFADYQRLFHAELTRRKLDIGLLATDASPGLGIWAESVGACEHG